jgi:hypothetical protein
MLGFSFWQIYRKPACVASGATAPIPTGVRIARIFTWIAATLWFAATAYAIYGLLNE